jgi:hypothetical protein
MNVVFGVSGKPFSKLNIFEHRSKDMMVICSSSNLVDPILTITLSKAASLEVRLVRLRPKSRDFLLPNVFIVTLPAAHDLYNYISTYQPWISLDRLQPLQYQIATIFLRFVSEGPLQMVLMSFQRLHSRFSRLLYCFPPRVYQTP